MLVLNKIPENAIDDIIFKMPMHELMDALPIDILEDATKSFKITCIANLKIDREKKNRPPVYNFAGHVKPLD